MTQNKRYHKKSHLSPRPASKFFLFLALGLFCPQYHKFLKMIKGQLNV